MLKEFYQQQSKLQSKQVPYGFSEKVMRALEEKYAPKQRHIYRWVFSSSAALALIALVLWMPFLYQPALLPDEAYTVISYRGSSKDSVAVLGDFNSWRPQSMSYKNGKWQLKLRVKKNQMYQYHFKVNGKLVADRENPVKSSGYFGTQNSVLIVMNGTH